MSSKQLTYLFSIPYLILAISVVAVKMIGRPDLENILKPTLLIILMIWFAINQYKKGIKIPRVFMLALLFSLLGDVFLMPFFDQFIFGLLFFLLSHLFYISVFMKGKKQLFFPTLKKSKLFLISILSAYIGLTTILMFAIFKLDSVVLLVAIPIYATVLLIMVLSTFVFSKVHFYDFGRYILLGGIFFFISDSILAINKFVLEIDYSPIWVMGTYTLAQWLLVYGFMNSKKKS
ncbi:MAG: lysoplasmalogenase [Bacteroidales bacterium]|nr:lysoplasmalogenase [Bacteroidales bacterium]